MRYTRISKDGQAIIIDDNEGATSKLYMLENIEEDFGFELIRLIDAKSIFVDEKYGLVSVFDNFRISVIEQCLYVSVDDCDDTGLSFDDYGKTWAFTKEELKNEKKN